MKTVYKLIGTVVSRAREVDKQDSKRKSRKSRKSAFISSM